MLYYTLKLNQNFYIKNFDLYKNDMSIKLN